MEQSAKDMHLVCDSRPFLLRSKYWLVNRRWALFWYTPWSRRSLNKQPLCGAHSQTVLMSPSIPFSRQQSLIIVCFIKVGSLQIQWIAACIYIEVCSSLHCTITSRCHCLRRSHSHCWAWWWSLFYSHRHNAWSRTLRNVFQVLCSFEQSYEPKFRSSVFWANLYALIKVSILLEYLPVRSAISPLF